MRQVEQADSLADGLVLLEDARILDGHLPAGKVDQPSAERAVALDERGLRASRGSVAVSRVTMPATRSACFDDLALGRELISRTRLVDRQPAHVVELVVVPVEAPPVASIRKKCTVLWMRSPSMREEVVDRADRRQDADLETGLLLDLAQRGLLDGLSRRPACPWEASTWTPLRSRLAHAQAQLGLVAGLRRTTPPHEVAREVRPRRPASGLSVPVSRATARHCAIAAGARGRRPGRTK